jgi:hypothetical protein
VRETGDLSGYLAKVDGGWGAGLEIARADLKSGKNGNRYTPWDLLTELADTGEAWLADLWCEYDAATFGKRAIYWSPGLKKRLGVEEVNDEELAASEGADVGLVRAYLESKSWDRGVRRGDQGDVLDGIENVAAVLFWLTDWFGHEIEPLSEGGP